ncbi:hypothetical protein [Selenihalanaerobacter shriftii]|uniref:Uncharacterized protein n=1 Tax=Selenihalanaerobacter shriftii TaxID=142842 RepID=A0A1T4LE10_9FIRM|nr:hypothetical protein [Selenihalanaerobacter shriftii]SJZ53009.1 hypothetical protein SAMN02745118_01101 [Selenihalanaerobacter shriftii]
MIDTEMLRIMVSVWQLAFVILLSIVVEVYSDELEDVLDTIGINLKKEQPQDDAAMYLSQSEELEEKSLLKNKAQDLL